MTLIHLMDRLMERQLDAPAAALLRDAMRRNGVEVVLRRHRAGASATGTARASN